MTNVRVHFLDVGPKEYGDCVLCELDGTTVLIDGAHPGDQIRIRDQLRSLLGVAGPITVDLLVASHAHQDHIGCLPTLVQDGQLRARWSLVADPDLGWPVPLSDDRVGAVIAGLREEVLGPATDAATIERFLADAAGLENRYRRMLATLDEDGSVVRLGRDSTKALRDAFAPVGLRILGPSKRQLLACQSEIEDAIDSLTAVASDLLSTDAEATEVDAYRRLVAAQAEADAVDARSRPGPPINNQSIVMSFELDGVKLLFAGDMQFEAPQVSNAEIEAELAKLRGKVRAGAPYDLVKISHHGSDNAFSESVLDDLGDSTLFGICAGSGSTHHPNREVLDLLNRRRRSLKWVRTDRNGLSTVSFGAGSPRINAARGRVNDPAPNDDRPLARTVEARTSVGERPVTVTRPVEEEVEVVARIPHTATTVRVTVEIAPGGAVAVDSDDGAPERVDASLAGGRTLPRLLFVTSRDRLVDNVGAPAAERALEVIRAAGQALYDELPANAEVGEAGRLVRERLDEENEVEGVVLLGGYDAVPSRRFDCLPPSLRERLGPTNDPDDFVVWSDDGYGERAGKPALPVSRIPDGKTPELLLAALTADDRSRGEQRRGVRNRERPFADAIYGTLAGGLPFSSPHPRRPRFPRSLWTPTACT